VRLIQQRRLRLALVLLLATVGFGYGPCSGKQQPKTVADILSAAGNTKRDLRSRDEITAQQDYDISAKLAEANRAYKAFVNDELARLANSNSTAPDPAARQEAIRALTTSLKSIEDPSALGIKSANAQKLWRESTAGLSTILAGLDALQGGS
jgi:hypothetical protein